MSRKTIGLALGPLLFVLLVFMPTPDALHTAASRHAEGSAVEVSELARSMQVVAGILALMVVWWITEAIPLPATALIPACLIPWFNLTGIHAGEVVALSFRAVAVNYANPVIFLFLGGFLLAAAMQKWKLDRRFTLWFLTRGRLANDARKVLLGMMAVSACLSMWISNTATTAIMLPLGLGILGLLGGKPGESRYGTALMLGIAWAASVGGMGTIIGTPPNGIALGILDTTLADDPSYQRITFLDWMAFGVPYVILFVLIVWLLLLKLFPPETLSIPGGKDRLLAERATLGMMSRGEKTTVGTFAFAVACWISNPFWDSLLPEALSANLRWVDEYTIGLTAGVLLFVLPVKLRSGEFVLSWADSKTVDWGTLILFGGGIALSDAMFKTGVAAWIAHDVIGAFGAPTTLMMMFVVVLMIDLLTEVTSNTAVTSMMVPIVISVAIAAGEEPVTLAVAAALAGSMAFMLPVATPPNALVFGTGYIKLKDMVRAGFVLDILGWLFTIGIILVFGVHMFGVLKL